MQVLVNSRASMLNTSSSVGGTPQIGSSSRREISMPARYSDLSTGQEGEENISVIYCCFAGPTNPCQIPSHEEEIVDHLYALPLPPEYWNYAAWWTGSSWQWSMVNRHEDVLIRQNRLPRGGDS